MNKLKIAVFGGGYWGKNLIKNFSNSGMGEVKIVCDLNQDVLSEIASQFPSVEVTSDFQRIIKILILIVWRLQLLPVFIIL